MFFTQTKVICRFEDRKLDVNGGKINREWCFFGGGDFRCNPKSEMNYTSICATLIKPPNSCKWLCSDFPWCFGE